MKYLLAVLLSLCLVTPAAAQVSVGVGISLPSVRIGINLPFPELVVVPGYPVYYAPQADANLFFYDGFYWVFRNDTWYTCAWYNGPWAIVDPFYVPVFILRVPVSFYRYPPPYFVGWQRDAPPRWGEHWGRDWKSRRGGWDRWDSRSAPAPAPIPTYQREYSGDRYPRVEQQVQIHNQQYRYQPQDPVVREHHQRIQKASPAVEVRPAPQRKEEQSAPARAPEQQNTPARSPSAPQREQQTVPRAQPMPDPKDPNPQHQAPQRAPQQAPRVVTPPQGAPTSQGQPPAKGQEQHGQPDHGQQEHGQSQEKGHNKPDKQ